MHGETIHPAAPSASPSRRYSPRVIYKHSNATQTKWNRGDYQVQLMVPGQAQPIGFCDGTDEDIEELRAIAEAEGAEGFNIERKVLKTGREVWTLG